MSFLSSKNRWYFYVKINEKKSAEPLSNERKKETTKLSM